MASYQYIFSLENLSKTWSGGKTLFENINLSFLPNAKIGIVGINGSGKSTIANAIYSGPDSILDNESNGAYDAGHDIEIDGVTMFKIGHKATSCTEIPGYVPFFGDQKYLIDAPGLSDTNVLKEYPN